MKTLFIVVILVSSLLSQDMGYNCLLYTSDAADE